MSADEKIRAVLELIEKWRAVGYQAVSYDDCADELEEALAAAQGQPEKESGR